jgi:hypothetical protein
VQHCGRPVVVVGGTSVHRYKTEREGEGEGARAKSLLEEGLDFYQWFIKPFFV